MTEVATLYRYIRTTTYTLYSHTLAMLSPDCGKLFLYKAAKYMHFVMVDEWNVVCFLQCVRVHEALTDCVVVQWP